MITDRQAEVYRTYLETGSYARASEELDISTPTVHSQVQTVQERIEEIVEVVELSEGVHQTSFGLKFLIDGNDVIFLNRGDSEWR